MPDNAPAWIVATRNTRERECGPGLHIYRRDDRQTVVDTGNLEAWPLSEEHQALIEAAPDLLAAAMMVIDCLENGGGFSDDERLWNESVSALELAIANATRTTPTE